MSWNESGGNNRDPWRSGGRGSGGGGGGGDKGPPDLDQVVRDLQKRLRGMFGGRGGGGEGGSRGVSPPGGGLGVGLIAGLLIVVWLLTGFYRIDDAERGVVLTFGQYSTTTLPGLHWRVPWPIQSVETVNVSQIDRFPVQTRMLTEDENIVQVDLAVQFRRSDPVAFLFNVRSPEETLAEVTESAIREVVGKSNLDFILTEGRAEVAARTMQLIQTTLNSYGTGIEVTSVNLQDANFPSQVQSAVQDAIKAREDRERLQLEAQAYANDVVPRARGEAARILEDAQGYRERVIADADGEADRFVALLEEFQLAPEVTRERLYIETMQDVLQRSNKVLIDASGSGNLLYLPLDRLMERHSGERADAQQRGSGGTVQARPLEPLDTQRAPRDDRRTRASR